MRILLNFVVVEIAVKSNHHSSHLESIFSETILSYKYINWYRRDDIHHYHAPLEILASVQFVFYHHPVFKELTVQNNASFEQSKSRSPRTKRGKLERKVNDTYRTSKVLKTSKVELFQNTLLTNHVDLNKDASELTDKLF